jgi:hypothetical protein
MRLKLYTRYLIKALNKINCFVTPLTFSYTLFIINIISILLKVILRRFYIYFMLFFYI